VKINKKYIITFCVIIIIALNGFGQAVPPPIPPPPPPGLPIDGGVGLLFLAGIIFGVKSYIKK